MIQPSIQFPADQNVHRRHENASCKNHRISRAVHCHDIDGRPGSVAFRKRTDLADHDTIQSRYKSGNGIAIDLGFVCRSQEIQTAHAIQSRDRANNRKGYNVQ